MRVLAVSNAALSSAHFGVGQLRDDAETAATTDPGAFNSPILFHCQIILSSDTSGTKLLQPFFSSQSILQNRKLILHIFM